MSEAKDRAINIINFVNELTVVATWHSDEYIENHNNTSDSDNFYKELILGLKDSEIQIKKAEELYNKYIGQYNTEPLFIDTKNKEENVPIIPVSVYESTIELLNKYRDIWKTLRPGVNKEILNPYYKKRTFDDLFNNFGEEEEATHFLLRALKRSMGNIEGYEAGDNKLVVPKDVISETFLRELAPDINDINGQWAHKESGNFIFDYCYTTNTQLLQRHKINLKNVFFTYRTFDVLTVLDNFYREGNTFVTPSKIFYALEKKGAKPTSKQLKNIVDMLRFGQATTVYIDVTQLTDYDFSSLKNKDILLEATATLDIDPEEEALQQIEAEMQEQEEQETGVVNSSLAGQYYNITIHEREKGFIFNGKATNTLIEIKGYSLLHEMAMNTKHITDVSKDMNRLYTGRRDERFSKVKKYLIDQISWLKNKGKKKRSNIFYLDSISNYVGDNEGRNKVRNREQTKKVVFQFLDECCIPTNYIHSYIKTTIEGKEAFLVFVSAYARNKYNKEQEKENK